MAHSIGVAMLGGNPLLGRNAHDFYETPEDVLLALLLKLGARVQGPIGEPFCGNGAICSILDKHGHASVASDLRHTGYGEGGLDALAMTRLPAPQIISNPPFDLAPAIIEHFLAMGPDLFVLLLKSSFWHAKTRIPLWRRRRPSAIYALSWRPDFEKRGAPTMEMSWVVWDARHEGPTEYDILDRPPGFKNPPRPKKPRKPKLAVVTEETAPELAANAPARKPRVRKPRLKVVAEA